ncbi:ThuA domain-containing protein [Micromonospora sp. LOL_023]|uniref:ThuA domain-containing protein n=1 Tax=Micromonospora sp. LOL_023 TaxID=3345418 RepID=UPI003A83E6BC
MGTGPRTGDQRRRAGLLGCLAALVMLACTGPAGEAGQERPAGDGQQPGEPAYRVLVYSRTTGFRHDSIPAGVAAVGDLGAAHGFAVDATEDPADFTPDNLRRYAAVVFLNTSGDVLDDAGRAAFAAYIGDGGGFVGVHAAADTEHHWPFYGELVGAYFARHPQVQPATVEVVDRTHPATAHLPTRWERTDEWYDYQADPTGARILATLDETSYAGAEMGQPHPHVWCKTHAGGRAFYTGGGHTIEAYAEPQFRAHLLGGIRYAAGQLPADCSSANYP